MAQGLSVQRLISVTINLSPTAAQFQNFDTALIVGDSDVVNTTERIRSYNTLNGVAADFGTTAPEYLAALLFFGQTPQPSQLYIGRWAKTATQGLLIGGILTAAQQAITAWNSINNGSFQITVNGAGPSSITGLDFTAQTNLNGVAAVIAAALAAAIIPCDCEWDGSKFTFESNTTGPASTVSALLAGLAGTDISAQLACTAATLGLLVPGINAETALAAVVILDDLQTRWYGLTFAAGLANADIADADYLAVAAYVEASANPHLFGVTTQEAAALTNTDTTSIGYQLKQLGYYRTFYQWSAQNPFAVTSIFGRGCSVNFAGNLTVITFMWKQEPGVIAESLTASQADNLDANNYNYFAAFNNNTSIVVNGKVANGAYIDEMWDLDWFKNQMQTDVYNLLYTSPTKIPQTDAGEHQIKNAIEASCVAAVNNGTLAPGVWNAAGFGNLQEGDFLSKGFYVYQPPIATQAPADRAARKSVPFQVAAKLAGAVHSVSITVNVDR